MYIFTFTHPQHPIKKGEYIPGLQKRKILNDKGVLQRDYLRTKVKKENYSVPDCKSSSFHKTLEFVDMTNHPLYGVWLTTTDTDLTLMLRLGIEDFMNPKTSFKFQKGFIIEDLNEVESELKKYGHELTSLRRDKKVIENDRYYFSQVDNFVHHLTDYQNRISSETIKSGMISVRNNIDTDLIASMKKEIDRDIKRYENLIEQKYDEIENYLNSFRMKV